MLAAVKDKDIVVCVHADAADFLEAPAGRQFRPVLHRLECVCANADGRHAQGSLFVAVGGEPCHDAKVSASQVVATIPRRHTSVECPLLVRIGRSGMSAIPALSNLSVSA